MKKDFLPISAIQEKVATFTLPQKALLFAGTFLILIAGFYFLLYKDQSARIGKLKTSIVEQEKRLSAVRQAARDAERLQMELAQSEEEFANLLALLPDQKEIPGILENVSQLGAQVGLENILFQPQAEVPHEFYASIPVRLDLLGTYSQLGVFLDNISKLNRILKVDSIQVIRQKDNPRLQVNCTLVTYRFLDTKAEKSDKGAQGGKASAKK